MKILMELRPTLSGYAGIPQETRLLFSALARLEGVEMEGLIQSSEHLLPRGIPPEKASGNVRPDEVIDRLSRVVVAIEGAEVRTLPERIVRWLVQTFGPPAIVLKAMLRKADTLDRFDPVRFKDFVWRRMFSKTLPASEFEHITTQKYRLARTPWGWMHGCGLMTGKLMPAVYPHIDTRGFDVMIGETPYPARISAGTRLVIRYHDAIPLLMPHTISDRVYHQASHYQALRRNVLDGAWFACVSEATRNDLLSVFPQIGDRAVVISNMVSHHYHDEPVDRARVAGIAFNRQSLTMAKLAAQAGNKPTQSKRNGAGAGASVADLISGDFLLMVSTIEPRKNHLALLAAWETLRSTTHPDLQLILVGGFGWGQGPIIDRVIPWIGRGLHMLEDVPASELRVLYQHARITVCPSFGEGFDYSGVEAMCSGGVVAASDIPVHREVYGEAAVYFSPYAIQEVRECLQLLLASPDGERERLVAKGEVQAGRYSPDRLSPEWQEFLAKVVRA